MTEALGGWLRGARAVVAVALTLGLAAAGHAVGGGTVPSGALVVLVVLLTPLALAATAVPWTFRRAVAALAAGQAGVHLLLTLMAPATTGYAVAPRPVTAHLGHDASLGLLAGAGHLAGSAGHAAGAAAGHAATLHLTPSMLLAHLVATVLAAALVAYGERALWAVLARVLPDLPGVPVLVPGPAATVSRAPRRLHGIRLLRPPGRGPPRPALAA